MRLPLVIECLEPFEIASHGQYNHVCTNHVFRYTNHVFIIPIMYLLLYTNHKGLAQLRRSFP